MTISKQKLVLAFTLALLSAVPAQAMIGQEENQETPNTEIVLSERNARLEQQHVDAFAAGLRPTLTLVDLDAECEASCCEHYEFLDGMRETIEEKNKTIDELQARIQKLEAKNKPWSTRKKVAVATAAAIGCSFAASRAGLMPKAFNSWIRDRYYAYLRTI